MSSTRRWKYDVFLSFYGQDTRKGFTDHLYAGLKERGLIVFRDDEKLERGKYISEELLKAIEESYCAVVVISENYAFSKWCLNELAKIVECREDRGLRVYPVFYHVGPSDVRKQRKSFAKAFARHGEGLEVDEEKMMTWRAALRDVGYSAGWHIDHNRYESKIVKEIIEKILGGFPWEKVPFERKYSLIGIESRAAEVMKLLDIGVEESGGVRFIGIHGMGGVGKTTLANFIYDMVSPQFEIRCFISCKVEDRRIDRLQNQLIYEIMGEEIKYNRMDDRARISVISRILRHKRVLLVLDDVDSEEQIEALAWSPDLFGEGSRIILTSRDAHLLNRHATASTAIYEVKLLNDNEALELFCCRAFEQPFPPVYYEKVSREFVNYAQGLPLALNSFGGFGVL